MLQGFIYVFISGLTIVSWRELGWAGLVVGLIALSVFFLLDMIVRKATGDKSNVIFGNLFPLGEQSAPGGKDGD